MTFPEWLDQWKSKIAASQTVLESDEIDLETLEATATAYDSLVDGTFYEKQEAAHQWLKQQSLIGENK